MLRMRSFPFSVAPFSVTPLVAGVEKVCIRQGPPFDRSGNRDSAETLQFHPATDRGDRSGEEIYYETQVAGSDLCAAAPPPKDWARTKLELDVRFNARGPDGLLDGTSTGQPSKLNDTQRPALSPLG